MKRLCQNSHFRHCEEPEFFSLGDCLPIGPRLRREASKAAGFTRHCEEAVVSLYADEAISRTNFATGSAIPL
ncbi:MAG: hypothetical protein Q8O01_05050, partial [Candidatus Omnitrophota bacterium]|nr:hypothetical protein [Candidatus Omnitrophota bacterium]